MVRLIDRLLFIAVLTTGIAITATAQAQQESELAGAPSAEYDSQNTSENDPENDPEKAKASKEPKRGDFNAGGQVRLPNGPDDAGEFATFNWVAFDVLGTYYLLDSVTVNGTAPLAIIKPDSYLGTEPSLVGGLTLRLDAKLPRLPKLPLQPKAYPTDLTLMLAVAYMREGAMLLSAKDFPFFSGDFQPGFTGGTNINVKLGSVVDFSMTPIWVYQSGTDESLTAVQLPLSLIVQLGSLVKVSADAGVFTGDDYSFGGSKGGRIAAGGSLTVKIGPILAHAGAGVASLLSGGAYPTIRDSVYIDLNVKYAK